MIAVIGAFDGFHAGHSVLLAEAAKLARENNTGWAVVTFTPHPGVYFDGSKKLLFSEYEKCAEAKFLRIPEVIRLPFEQIHNMSPEDFLEMLMKQYSISGIVVGEDFRFGRCASGDCTFIKEFCSGNMLSCSIIETVRHLDGCGQGEMNKISSRVLREWYENGRADILRDALAFPCPVSGIVVHGDGRGSKLGFPTVNISVSAEKMIPAEGVYAVSVLTGAGWRAGAMFTGKPPMFKNVKEARIEVHISDFKEDLYGKRVTVFLEEFIRPPVMFKDVAELARDIKSCVAKAVLLFNKKHGPDGESYYGALLTAFAM